jgi:hypothetical protein
MDAVPLPDFVIGHAVFVPAKPSFRPADPAPAYYPGPVYCPMLNPRTKKLAGPSGAVQVLLSEPKDKDVQTV